MRNTGDTICAEATCAGTGGIAILRISGPDARRILKKIFRPLYGRIVDRMLTYGHVMAEGEDIDECMAVMLPGPASYTREDVAEIHCHGSRSVVARVLRLMTENGARPAEAGEFTYRAFLGGRIDLSRAEAVMRMIHADSERGMKSAMRQLSGGVANYVNEARREIVEMLADIEAGIDFPDEVDEVIVAETVAEKCREMASRIRASIDPARGRLEDDGLRCALFGCPNAGKSSLLNALLGEDRAIVTAIPGTTRDTLREKTQIRGLSVILEDTAGMRDTIDEVEAIGVARAQKALDAADVRMMVVDGSKELNQEETDLMIRHLPQIIVLSKEDLSDKVSEEDIRAILPNTKVCRVSVRTGYGMDGLEETLVSFAPEADETSAVFTQERHADAASKCCASLEAAVETLRAGFGNDLAAIDLRNAYEALGEITGDTVSEKVIDRIFEKFCVGK